MTTCKLCSKEISEHEVGRCLDAWVGSIRKEIGGEHCYHTNSEKVKEGERICCACDKITKNPDYEEGCDLQHKPYSTDLNPAIELLPDFWVIQKQDGYYRIYSDSHFSKQIAVASTLALALVRAYLIEKIKEEGKK